MDLATDLDGAFPDFVRRNQDAVYSVARRLTQGRDDAEDAAQEAFVRAYRALAGWDAARRRSLHEGPWLAAIALNVCRNQARARSRRPVTSPLDGVDPASDGRVGPETVVGRDWWAGAVAGLPDLYRAPVVLRHVQGLSYEEAAEALGRPVGTVKAQVHRGVALLRAAVEEQEEP
jgi:RNA polymerase sigma-70 factor (ECF subfamily)